MTLSSEDLSDLTRFFSSAGHQQRSIQGPILERAWLMQPPPAEPGVEITARPTAEVREAPRVEPDVSDFELFGRVSRKMRTLHGIYRLALERFHGDAGVAFAVTHKAHGSHAALHELTKPGRALLKLERADAERQKTKIERSAAEMEESARARTVAELLALKAAVELKDRAEAAYARAGREDE